jgi:hypothetical protein
VSGRFPDTDERAARSVLVIAVEAAAWPLASEARKGKRDRGNSLAGSVAEFDRL